MAHYGSDESVPIDFPQHTSFTVLAPELCSTKLHHDGKRRGVFLELEAMPPEFPSPAMTVCPAKYLDGSWRRMYFCQPTCEVYIIESKHHGGVPHQ